jgi:ATP-dependent DNA helicase PIF1
LNPSQGVCNGTRLIVNNYSKNLITATISTGPKKGNKVFIPRIKHMDMNTKNGFTLIRKQFPIRLCFGMTIHKSQGQSLDKVGLYITEPIFGHGILYTAMSRVIDPSKLKILIPPNASRHGKIDGHTGTYISNVVYREAFM